MEIALSVGRYITVDLSPTVYLRLPVQLLKTHLHFVRGVPNVLPTDYCVRHVQELADSSPCLTGNPLQIRAGMWRLSHGVIVGLGEPK
jgi:hypothetical protein